VPVSTRPTPKWNQPSHLLGDWGNMHQILFSSDLSRKHPRSPVSKAQAGTTKGYR
jgi:hypothetical protein